MSFKIVRDRQQAWCQENGIKGAWRIAPDPVAALRRKLGEEYAEFTESNEPDELYDIIDVASELLGLLDPDGVHRSRHHAKVRKFGTFIDHLEWSAIPWEGEVTWDGVTAEGVPIKVIDTGELPPERGSGWASHHRPR